MEKDFVISKVGWHTKKIGSTETIEQIHLRFRSLIDFLQNNGLTTKVILEKNAPITDELAIKVSDLTENGFQLIKKCHDKWLRGIDKGKNPTDMRVFEKELTKS